MKPWKVPNNEPLSGVLDSALQYVRPWSDMWPLFCVRLLAVRMGSSWRLIHASWIGRVTKPDDWEPRHAEFKNSFYVDDYLQAVDVWPSLEELSRSTRLSWTRSNGTPHQIDIPDGASNRAGGSLPDNPEGPYVRSARREGLLEDLPWPLLWCKMSASWESDAQWELARSVAASEHGRRSFEALAESLLGEEVGQQATINLEFPLALKLTPTTANHRLGSKIKQWELRCRAPLRLMETKITPSGDGVLWDGLQPATVQMSPEQSEGPWHDVARIDVPSQYAWIFIEPRVDASANIEASDFRLRYYSVQASDARALKGTAEHLYRRETQWKQDLMEGEGDRFEVALANILVRFRYPVFFGGGLTQTPGIDLVVVHPYQAQTLAVVSCKGGSGRVSFDDRKNFSEAIAGIEERLPGWVVRAVVATQLDPARLSASNMGNSSEFIVWGNNDLQLLWDATSAQQIAGLLWDDPRFLPSTLAGFGDPEDPL